MFTSFETTSFAVRWVGKLIPSNPARIIPIIIKMADIRAFFAARPKIRPSTKTKSTVINAEYGARLAGRKLRKMVINVLLSD
jgi:hypothetical protein